MQPTTTTPIPRRATCPNCGRSAAVHNDVAGRPPFTSCAYCKAVADLFPVPDGRTGEPTPTNRTDGETLTDDAERVAFLVAVCLSMFGPVEA